LEPAIHEGAEAGGIVDAVEGRTTQATSSGDGIAYAGSVLVGEGAETELEIGQVGCVVFERVLERQFRRYHCGDGGEWAQTHAPFQRKSAAHLSPWMDPGKTNRVGEGIPSMREDESGRTTGFAARCRKRERNDDR